MEGVYMFVKSSHSISAKVFLLIVLLSTILMAKEKILFIHCTVKEESITLKESFVVDGKAPGSSENLNGDFQVSLKDRDGKILYKKSVRSPLLTPMDASDENGELFGGIKLADSALLVIRVPYISETDEISISKIDKKQNRASTSLFNKSVSEVLLKKRRSEAYQVASEMELVGGDGSDNRVDFVILSEGYTQSELNSGKFKRDLELGFNHMFTRTPYKEYKDYFNTYAISVASSSSGSGGYFQSIVSGRLIYLGGTGTSRVSQLLQKHVPTYDMVLVLINTTTYGGAGAQFATASVNAQSGELILHETGHGYALLADEYDYPGASTFESVNATAETDRTRIKWNVWIENSTPIPTPETSSYAGVVGLFEGAMYKSSGFYRPKYQCKMQSLGQPFCEVCRETIIARAYEECSPIDSYSPQSTSVDYNQLPNHTLELDLLEPATNSINVSWWLNGTELSNTGASLDLSTVDMVQGINEVIAYVEDETEWVRIAYNKPQLNDEVTWSVNFDKTNINNSKNLLHSKLNISVSNELLHLVNLSKGVVKIDIVNPKGVTIKSISEEVNANDRKTISLKGLNLAKGFYLLKIKVNDNLIHERNFVNL